jgi:hypothetical protein
LVDDVCWDNRPKEGSDGWNAIVNLSNEEKVAMDCSCMGPNIFDECEGFPGVLNEDFYTTDAQADLGRTEPGKPAEPTPYPSLTPYPSPTPHPTLTPIPTLTPLPTPDNPADQVQYQEDSKEQGDLYAELREDQGDVYTEIRQQQGDEYTALRQQQGDEYQAAREAQGDEYEVAVTDWGESKADWEENRQKAVSGAEGMIQNVFEGFGHAFRGAVTTRWAWMGGIMIVMLGLIIVFQKMKDTV